MSDSGLPIVLDLFSGTGSATQPFVECGKHRVIRVDNSPKCRPDIRADVRRLPFPSDLRAQFVWASPPCGPYSALRYRYDHIWEADRSCWLAALEAIQRFRPRYWVLENVKMAQWVWGRAPYHFGPFFLWGYFPKIPAKVPWTTSFKGTHFSRATGRRWNDPKTAAERATIPLELAEAVHRAVCE